MLLSSPVDVKNDRQPHSYRLALLGYHMLMKTWSRHRPSGITDVADHHF